MAWQAIVEVAKVTAEVAEKVAQETAKNITKFNPDKRLDPSKIKPEDASKKFNPDKRIDVKESLEKVLDQYKKELTNLAEMPDTIKNLADLKLDDLKKLSPDEVDKKRTEFETKKKDLRTEWEKVNNRPWPTYDKDVLNSRGEPIRKAGMKMDAHHIKPLSLGGENVVSNITPVSVTNHIDIHLAASACSALQKAII